MEVPVRPRLTATPTIVLALCTICLRATAPRLRSEASGPGQTVLHVKATNGRTGTVRGAGPGTCRRQVRLHRRPARKRKPRLDAIPDPGATFRRAGRGACSGTSGLPGHLSTAEHVSFAATFTRPAGHEPPERSSSRARGVSSRLRPASNCTSTTCSAALFGRRQHGLAGGRDRRHRARRFGGWESAAAVPARAPLTMPRGRARCVAPLRRRAAASRRQVTVSATSHPAPEKITAPG